MRLAHARRGDAHELRPRAQLANVLAAGVAHRGAQAAGELVQDGDDAALVRNAALDALGDEFFEFGRGVLEVAVARAMPLAHRTERAHAAVALEARTLEEFDLARGFFGAGEQTADHHAVRAGGERLGEIARIADAAVGDQRHTGTLERGGDVGDGGDLRHAHACDDARGADGARTDTDLDGISPAANEIARGLGGDDVAGDDL